MNLYLYHHCPFCVRADMVANYKQVPHKKIYLASDDEATPMRLVNAKQAPILQMDDGRAMPESLDIAKRLDELGNPERPMRAGGDVTVWNDAFAGVRRSILSLQFPRNIRMGFPEFSEQSARDYFQNKKEAVIECRFDEALAASDQHIAVVAAMLASLPVPVSPAAHADQLGWDDVMIYPGLRNLSMVKGLPFPPVLRRYMDDVSRITATELFFDRAI